jgi:hypothetical protein
MSENRAPLPKMVVMIIMLFIFAITVSGYALFYHAQKKLGDKDREFEIIKEKSIHAEEDYNDLKKKYDGTSEELKQVNKDYEVILQKHQECKEKQEELQAKFDEMQQSSEKMKKDLRDAQQKLGITPEPENTHPMQLLNQPKDDQSTQTAAPAGYHCPMPEVVTANASAGNWQEEKISWWVDYTRRPLNPGEQVKSLFKILYDGQTIACYYELGGDDESVWMVVKGDNKDKKAIVTGKNGWTPCPTDECISICNKDKLGVCDFTLKQ